MHLSDFVKAVLLLTSVVVYCLATLKGTQEVDCNDHERNEISPRSSHHRRSAPHIPINLVPVSLLNEINNVSTQDVFAKLFTEEGSPSLNSLQTRKFSYPYATLASCSPQLVAVPTIISEHPTQFYFPMCARIERCGGCCSHDEIFECAPTKTEEVLLQVIKTHYLGGEINKFDTGESVVVKLVRHLECACQCKQKPEHCLPNQKYMADQCRCQCINPEEVQSSCQENQYFDLFSCSCKCREIRSCTTGLIYSNATCSCQKS